EQLGYIIGAQNRDKGLLRYYWEWRFKHPNVNDFMRVMEKESGLQLDWYRMFFVNTTKHIDYGIDSLYEQNGKAMARLHRIGGMPMPIDLVLTTANGKKVMHYIPLSSMFGEKPQEDRSMQRITHTWWDWTHPTYEVELNVPLSEVSNLEIDPSYRMADIDRGNNVTQAK